MSDREICIDCGTQSAWRWLNEGEYCKRCHRDAGYSTWSEVDPDHLARFLQQYVSEKDADEIAQFVFLGIAAPEETTRDWALEQGKKLY